MGEDRNYNTEQQSRDPHSKKLRCQRKKIKGNVKYNALLKTSVPFTSLITEKTPYSIANMVNCIHYLIHKTDL